MSRRGLGFVTAFTLLVTAIVVTVAARRVVGRPVAASIPGPPSVGDCLVDDTVVSWLYNENPAYSSRRFRPCSGSRYGEVVAVVDDSRSPTQVAAASLAKTHPRGMLRTDDPVYRACHAALGPYLGLPLGPHGDGEDALDGWTYVGSAVPAPAGPDEVQKAAGQHWVACVAAGADPGQETGTVYLQAAQYERSARLSYATGSPPAPFALCSPENILPGILQPVNCSTAHAVEIFGETRTLGKDVTQAQLSASCARLVEG